MRRSLILTAVSIAAFSWGLSADPAAGADKQHYYTITFQEGRLAATAPPSAALAPSSAVDKWKPTKPQARESVAKVDSFTVKQGVKPMTYKLDRVYVKSWSTSGDAAPPKGPDVTWDVAEYRAGDQGNSRPVGTSDLTMKRGTSPAAGMDGPMFRVHDDKNSGAATGINRLIIVTTATGGCTVGKRYAAATLDGGGKRFVLTDVRITGCSRAGPEEQITFVYGSLGAR